MPEYEFSRLAKIDLEEITDYTEDIWGAEQAIRYLDELTGCFSRVSQTPETGRKCDNILLGCRRIEHGKHVVFYRLASRGILILRVLHCRMLPGRHEMGETE